MVKNGCTFTLNTTRHASHKNCAPGRVFEFFTPRLPRLVEVEVQRVAQSLNHLIAQSPIPFQHNFYAVDYLPENDRIRYTIHPDARKEVLKRLLRLNHQYFEQEAREGKHKEATVRKFYEQKGTAIPEEVSKWFGKGRAANTKRKTQNSKQQKPSGSLGLFDDEIL